MKQSMLDLMEKLGVQSVKEASQPVTHPPPPLNFASFPLPDHRTPVGPSYHDYWGKIAELIMLVKHTGHPGWESPCDKRLLSLETTPHTFDQPMQPDRPHGCLLGEESIAESH